MLVASEAIVETCLSVILVVPHAMQQNQHLEVAALFTQAMSVAINAVHQQSAVF